MNRNKKTRWAKNRTRNLMVGVGAALFFAGLVGYGIWTGSAEEVETSETKGKESAMEITITKANFEAEVLKSDRPVLVDFWAPWCGPCRMLAPVRAEVAAEQTDRIKVGKVNVDEEPELAAKFGIMSIPAVLLFKNGEVAANSIGYVPKEDLNAFVSANI